MQVILLPIFDNSYGPYYIISISWMTIMLYKNGVTICILRAITLSWVDAYMGVLNLNWLAITQCCVLGIADRFLHANGSTVYKLANNLWICDA